MRESPCPSRGRCIRSCSARSRVKCHPGRTRPNSERSHPAPVPWCPRGGSWASFLLSSRNSKTRTITKVGMGVAPLAPGSSTGAASASHRVTAETARPPARPPPPACRKPASARQEAGARLARLPVFIIGQCFPQAERSRRGTAPLGGRGAAVGQGRLRGPLPRPAPEACAWTGVSRQTDVHAVLSDSRTVSTPLTTSAKPCELVALRTHVCTHVSTCSCTGVCPHAYVRVWSNTAGYT